MNANEEREHGRGPSAGDDERRRRDELADFLPGTLDRRLGTEGVPRRRESTRDVAPGDRRA